MNAIEQKNDFFKECVYPLFRQYGYKKQGNLFSRQTGLDRRTIDIGSGKFNSKELVSFNIIIRFTFKEIHEFFIPATEYLVLFRNVC